MSDAIARIIGWEETTEVDVIGLRGYHRPGCVGYDPGVCECMSTPTPDDMLAWLRDDFHINITVVEGGYSVSLRFAAETERVNVTAPTLHAAIEQAVVAIGKADQ